MAQNIGECADDVHRNPSVFLFGGKVAERKPFKGDFVEMFTFGIWNARTMLRPGKPKNVK